MADKAKETSKQKGSDITRKMSLTIDEIVYEEIIEGNIELTDLTPDEVMNALNRAVGKYAQYGFMRANEKRRQAKFETNFKEWEHLMWAKIQKDPTFAKATGKTLDTQVILQNTKTWTKHQATIRMQNQIVDTLWVFIQTFELMTKTLQSILAMMRAELTSAQHSGFARGSGDLEEEY